MQLPTVRGSNLARQKVTFPANFSGDLNLVFIAFQQWHQRHVDSWVPLAESLTRSFAGFAYYEFPIIQSMNPLARTFINEGMRAGIPDPATRQRTITLYIAKRPFRQALNIPDEKSIWSYLFDRSGQVIWRDSGAYTAEKGARLQMTVVTTLHADARQSTNAFSRF